MAKNGENYFFKKETHCFQQFPYGLDKKIDVSLEKLRSMSQIQFNLHYIEIYMFEHKQT